MTEKEIDNILNDESGVILIKKDSEQLFWESILNNWISIISISYFLKRKKTDYLIVTKNRTITIIRNKIYRESSFDKVKSLNYNGNNSSLEITDKNKSFSFPINKLRINYEESKLIKKRLIEFMKHYKMTN